MSRLFLLCLLFAIAPAGIAPVAAQPMEAPSIPAAESAFDRGLRSYQIGQYEQAADHFRRAAEAFDYHQRTTAARLMEAKALYAAGELNAAASAVTAFLRAYPRSRYADDARALRRAAQDRLDAIAAVPEPTDLGIVLPMSDGDLPFTQALFNGVRLAVDAYNEANPERPIRMVFRDTEGSPRGARLAVEGLARSGVTMAVGPLYSEEAVAAGEAAEAERLTLVAPLATDAAVSAGRDYVFQANPTFEQRGLTMARYAAETEGPIGVVARTGTFGATMADAFRSEIERLGGTVPFVVMLPSEESWYRLPEILGDSLQLVEGVYLPVSGARGSERATGALRGLDQLVLPGERDELRVFGNTEWSQLDVAREQASQYNATFTADFFVDENSASAEVFAARYSDLAGVAPDRLAFAGYDVATFLLEQLDERLPEASVADALRRARPFAGLGHRIYFAGETVNEAMFILGYRDGRLVVLD
jgi:branched-chain amino acid transport system substrate-binding protein